MKSSDAKASKCHLKFSSRMIFFIKLEYLSSVISLKWQWWLPINCYLNEITELKYTFRGFCIWTLHMCYGVRMINVTKLLMCFAVKFNFNAVFFGPHCRCESLTFLVNFSNMADCLAWGVFTNAAEHLDYLIFSLFAWHLPNSFIYPIAIWSA